MTDLKYFLLLLLLYAAVFLQAQNIAIEGDFSFKEDIKGQIRKSIDKFQIKLGMYPEFDVKIVVLTEKNALKNLNVSSRLIKHSNAFYSSSDNTIYLQSDKNRFSDESVRTILHEYIHRFIFHYWPDAPLWFHEGMAQYFANGSDFNSAVDFARIKLFGNDMELQEMYSQYPHNTALWGAFYYKSYIVVKYLVTHRKMNFFRFIDSSYPGGSFNRTFFRAFFTSPDYFNREMDEIADRTASTYILFSISAMIPLLYPFLILIAWTVKKIKFYRTLKIWGEQEKLEEESIKTSISESEDSSINTSKTD